MSGLGRQKYTYADDLALWKFVIDQLKEGNVDARTHKGNSLWRLAEDRKITGKHSYQSMRDHFRKLLIADWRHTPLLSKADRDFLMKEIPEMLPGFPSSVGSTNSSITSSDEENSKSDNDDCEFLNRKSPEEDIEKRRKRRQLLKRPLELEPITKGAEKRNLIRVRRISSSNEEPCVNSERAEAMHGGFVTDCANSVTTNTEGRENEYVVDLDDSVVEYSTAREPPVENEPLPGKSASPKKPASTEKVTKKRKLVADNEDSELRPPAAELRISPRRIKQVRAAAAMNDAILAPMPSSCQNSAVSAANDLENANRTESAVCSTSNQIVGTARNQNRAKPLPLDHPKVEQSILHMLMERQLTLDGIPKLKDHAASLIALCEHYKVSWQEVVTLLKVHRDFKKVERVLRGLEPE